MSEPVFGAVCVSCGNPPPQHRPWCTSPDAAARPADEHTQTAAEAHLPRMRSRPKGSGMSDDCTRCGHLEAQHSLSPGCGVTNCDCDFFQRHDVVDELREALARWLAWGYGGGEYADSAGRNEHWRELADDVMALPAMRRLLAAVPTNRCPTVRVLADRDDESEG